MDRRGAYYSRSFITRRDVVGLGEENVVFEFLDVAARGVGCGDRFNTGRRVLRKVSSAMRQRFRRRTTQLIMSSEGDTMTRCVLRTVAAIGLPS